MTPPFLSLPLFFLLLLFLIRPPLRVSGHLCYSCSGQCHAGAPCNCQMGSCEADYCFAEKRPAELPGMVRLTKGCVKRPQRTRPGCDFAHFADHVQCLCAGDFCNDAVLMRVHTTGAGARRNVTCRNCPENRPRCGQTCQGQWCHLRVSTSASGCGFGPPTLPYLYQTPELLRHRARVCMSMSRGPGAGAQQLCVCNSNLCNDPDAMAAGFGSAPDHVRHAQADNPFATFLIRSLGGGQQQQQPRSLQLQHNLPQLEPVVEQLQDCVSCDLSSEDPARTSNCRQHRCRGHFCVYATQRVFVGGSFQSLGWSGGDGAAASAGGSPHQQPQAVLHESQGCLNISAAARPFVQLGCAHKWVAGEREEIFCACRGTLCNADLATASASAGWRPELGPLLLLLFFIVIITTIFRPNNNAF